MDMNNMGEMMKQAQAMQEKMKQTQAELADMIVVGEAGAGMVSVTMTGRHDCQHIEINDDLFNRAVSGDTDHEQARKVIEEMVAAAINDAVRKIEEKTRDKMMNISQGLNLPAGFPFPGSEQ